MWLRSAHIQNLTFASTIFSCDGILSLDFMIVATKFIPFGHNTRCYNSDLQSHSFGFGCLRMLSLTLIMFIHRYSSGSLQSLIWTANEFINAQSDSENQPSLLSLQNHYAALCKCVPLVSPLASICKEGNMFVTLTQINEII